ncbi:hypothetical protein ACG7TL_003262 [Trametes sanguinea]
MFEYMTQEEFALNTAYRHALRPIRHAELPESWRLRVGVPILIYGVYVDCPKEAILARARHVAQELGESLDDHPTNWAIRRMMDKYLAKMLNVPVWSESESEKSLLDIFFVPDVWMPPRDAPGCELSDTRFYAICVNQTDDTRNELYTKPENTLLFVKPLEKAWGLARGQLEAKWYFAWPCHSPEFHNWQSVDRMLEEIGMPDSLKNRN